MHPAKMASLVARICATWFGYRACDQIRSHLDKPKWKAKKDAAFQAFSGFQICFHLGEPWWKACHPKPKHPPKVSKSFAL